MDTVLPPVPAVHRRRKWKPALLPAPIMIPRRFNGRDQSFTPKKRSWGSPAREKKPPAEFLIGKSTSRLGPGPSCEVAEKEMEFSGSAFTLSPPPSSVPIPKFFLRPKSCCNADAGIDAGATDDLRRLLRLR